MGARSRRRSVQAGRTPMSSSGRPFMGRCEPRQRLWVAIAQGLSSEDARVSPWVGCGWFREDGGMPSITLVPLSGWHLSFAEREEGAILHAQRLGISCDSASDLSFSLGWTDLCQRSLLLIDECGRSSLN